MITLEFVLNFHFDVSLYCRIDLGKISILKHSMFLKIIYIVFSASKIIFACCLLFSHNFFSLGNFLYKECFLYRTSKSCTQRWSARSSGSCSGKLGPKLWSRSKVTKPEHTSSNCVSWRSQQVYIYDFSLFSHYL